MLGHAGLFSMPASTVTILYDLRYASDHFPGVGTYAYELLLALLGLEGDDRFDVLWDPALRHARFDLERVRRSPRVTWLERSAPPLGFFAPAIVGALARERRPSLYYSPFYLHPHDPRCPCVLTLHDVIPLEEPGVGAWRRWRFRMALHQARRARLVITVSEHSRQDLLRHGFTPDQVRVAMPGARPSSTLSKAPENLPSGRFALVVGADRPHKNFEVVARAWAALGAEPPLVLVAAGPGTRDVDSTFARTPSRHVFALGPVSEAEIDWLYANATLFLFPSRREGFGSPLAEALVRGVPSLAADIPVLHEVAGRAARFLPSDDPEAWAREVVRLAGSEAERDAMSAAGRAQAEFLSYRRTATTMRELWREAAGPSHGRGAPFQ